MKKVLPAKFFGGFLCILGGLSLEREGPSIQLGAMSGQGISRFLDRGKTKLQAGDRLTVMTDERDAGYIHDKMENLCYTSF